uniref:very-long-chain 3-oxoacyl-CoA synthase n=1 Tax=Xenopus tropicalis TaxID=8364 RepID=A0A803JHB3_XENTR
MNMSALTLQEYEFEKQFNENEAIQWMQENCRLKKLRKDPLSGKPQVPSILDNKSHTCTSIFCKFTIHQTTSFSDTLSGRDWQSCMQAWNVTSTSAMKKSFLFSALYAAFIFGGRHLMKQREKFELRKPLILWSLSLAVFRRYNFHYP